MPYVECPLVIIECLKRMSYVECRMSFVEFEMSNVVSLLNIDYQI